MFAARLIQAGEAVPGRGEGSLLAPALFPVRPALPGDPAPRASLRGIDDADEDGQNISAKSPMARTAITVTTPARRIGYRWLASPSSAFPSP